MNGNDTSSPSRVAVIAAVIFGCATLAAIVLMTWIVATDAARKDERSWQHNQLEELLQRTAANKAEYIWQHGKIDEQEGQLDALKLELELLKQEKK